MPQEADGTHLHRVRQAGEREDVVPRSLVREDENMPQVGGQRAWGHVQDSSMPDEGLSY